MALEPLTAVPGTVVPAGSLISPGGEQGVAGAPGPAGPAGATGAQGIQGPQGVKGDTGATGAQGPAGADGAAGPQGIPGPTGSPGATGAAGPGVPTGGAAGQPLTKNSATNYDAVWKDKLTLKFQPPVPPAIGVSGGAMLGMGATCKFTLTAPTSGKVLLTISGCIWNSATNYILFGLYYGAGNPPANGAGATGTAATVTSQAGPSSMAGVGYPVTVQAVVTGLVAGNQYWFDLLLALAGGTGNIQMVNASVVEL